MHNRNNPQNNTDGDEPLFLSNTSDSEKNQPVKYFSFPLTTWIPTKQLKTYNMIKGHQLLFWCIIFLLMVYGIEMWRKDGGVSSVGEQIIEILKMLIFSVSGYLFGTHENEQKDC